MRSRVLKVLFFALLIRPVVLIVLGLNIRNRKLLPLTGPAVLVANHNSHLDTLVLMSLYPLRQLHLIRPVAAADYFLRNKPLAWFALNIMDIIPLQRSGFKRDLFEQCHKALDEGEILLIFPEGSRGTAEQMGKLKSGVYHLLKERRGIPVCPVMLRGLGMALPRGTALLVPFNCDVIVGKATYIGDSGAAFSTELRETFEKLSSQCLTCHITDSSDPEDSR